MQNCYEGMHAALAQNIAGLTHLSAQQQEQLLEVEYQKAVAETECFIGLGSITDDSSLWDIMAMPDVDPFSRTEMLAEEASKLAAEKVITLSAEKWALRQGLEDSF